jgi:hypothetical protein
MTPKEFDLALAKFMSMVGIVSAAIARGQIDINGKEMDESIHELTTAASALSKAYYDKCQEAEAVLTHLLFQPGGGNQ